MHASARDQPRMEENGENTPLQTSTSTEDGRLPSAPDVTYDATLLDSQSEQKTRRDGETAEGGGEPVTEEGSSAEKKKAVRFGEEVREQPAAERSEGDGQEEDSEWMDILGSGELKKKVWVI